MIQIEIIVVSIVVEVQVLSNVYIEMSAHRNSLFERTVIKHAVTDQNTYAKYIITDKNILSLFGVIFLVANSLEYPQEPAIFVLCIL